MTPTQVYESYIAAENNRDRAGMERCLAPGLEVSVNGVPQLADRDADAAATDRLLERYPGYRRDLHRVFHAGQTVVAEWEMTAHGDPSRQIPELAVVGCTIAEIENGVITRAHLYTDPSGLDRILDPASSVDDS